jgi:hypothetical protein
MDVIANLNGSGQERSYGVQIFHDIFEVAAEHAQAEMEEAPSHPLRLGSDLHICNGKGKGISTYKQARSKKRNKSKGHKEGMVSVPDDGEGGR